MAAGVDAHPLYWPIDWPRTPAERRKRAPYRVTFLDAREDLMAELRRLGAEEICVSSNIPIRRSDGLPAVPDREPADPGVAVYFTTSRIVDGKRVERAQVLACDKWTHVRANLRSVGLCIEALRAIERSGASQVLERAYAGFAALPANTTPAAPPWRKVLGFAPAGAGYPAVTRDAIERAYRSRIPEAHPDMQGTTEKMVELNRARDAALAEVSG